MEISRRSHGDHGVSEERPRRAAAFPRSSGRRLIAWSRSAHGVLMASKELSLGTYGVHITRNVYKYLRKRAIQEKSATHVAEIVIMHINGSCMMWYIAWFVVGN